MDDLPTGTAIINRKKWRRKHPQKRASKTSSPPRRPSVIWTVNMACSHIAGSTFTTSPSTQRSRKSVFSCGTAVCQTGQSLAIFTHSSRWRVPFLKAFCVSCGRCRRRPRWTCCARLYQRCLTTILAPTTCRPRVVTAPVFASPRSSARSFRRAAGSSQAAGRSSPTRRSARPPTFCIC